MIIIIVWIWSISLSKIYLFRTGVQFFLQPRAADKCWKFVNSCSVSRALVSFTIWGDHIVYNVYIVDNCCCFATSSNYTLFDNFTQLWVNTCLGYNFAQLQVEKVLFLLFNENKSSIDVLPVYSWFRITRSGIAKNVNLACCYFAFNDFIVYLSLLIIICLFLIWNLYTALLFTCHYSWSTCKKYSDVVVWKMEEIRIDYLWCYIINNKNVIISLLLLNCFLAVIARSSG